MKVRLILIDKDALMTLNVFLTHAQNSNSFFSRTGITKD